MDTSSGFRGTRHLLWTAALVSAAFCVPASAHAACIAIKNASVERYFSGTRCKEPGYTTWQGAWTTHDDKATLNGTITLAASNGTVSVQKIGQLTSPTFQGIVTAWRNTDTATGQEDISYLLEGTWPLEKLAGDLYIRKVFGGEVIVADNRQPIP
jgi:uncharacterized protein CbrC (UPF0167 family)